MKASAIEQDKKRNSEKLEKPKLEEPKIEDTITPKPTRMSFILPALQNNRFSDDESSDNESLHDPNEKIQEPTMDLVSEIEALEVASAPAPTKPILEVTSALDPTTEKTTVAEKPATYEPIPFERPFKPAPPVIETPTVVVEVQQEIPEEKEATIEDIQKQVLLTAVAVAAANTVEIPTTEATQDEFKTMVDQATDLNPTDEVPVNHLAAILPAVEVAVKNVRSEKEMLPQPSRERQILQEDHEKAKLSREFEYSIEDPIDLDLFRDNVIAIQAIDPKDIPVNNLKPREQEKAGKIKSSGGRHELKLGYSKYNR